VDGWAVSEEWEDKGGVSVVFININEMYNNDVGKGGVRVYEAYEVKYRVAVVRMPVYFINLLRHRYYTYLYYSLSLTHTHARTHTHTQTQHRHQ
jgi:hypothetical protein